MKDEVIVVIVVVEAQDTEDAGTRSRSNTRAYADGWERIFGGEQERTPAPEDLN